MLPNLKPPEPKAMIDPIPTSADGKPRLGRFGELLDAEGNQVLGKVLTQKTDIKFQKTSIILTLNDFKPFEDVLLGPMRSHY